MFELPGYCNGLTVKRTYNKEHMRLSRRSFASTLLALPAWGQQPVRQLGNLTPTVQGIAASSPLSLSYLRPEFLDLAKWQRIARDKLFDLLQASPGPIFSPAAKMVARIEHDDFIEENLTFQTTPYSRVPAHVLIPKGRKLPAPAVVVLHDHGGFYLWGREKVVASDPEPAALIDFKRRYYGGRSIANELVRQGYVVIAIDAFYWGERRRLLDTDPPDWRDRTDLTTQRIQEFNARASQNEQLVSRALLTAGTTWPGVTLWDDLRTVDYLASRPEVDPKRISCVGLSVGGYRSFMLAALDPRIHSVIDVGWMTSYAEQIEKHVINTMGASFVIPGMYRYFDLPDLSALIAPRPLLVLMGTQDTLFPASGVAAAFDKIGKCYAKAHAAGWSVCKCYDAPHQFNAEMQADAWRWLQYAQQSGPGRPRPK